MICTCITTTIPLLLWFLNRYIIPKDYNRNINDGITTRTSDLTTNNSSTAATSTAVVPDNNSNNTGTTNVSQQQQQCILEDEALFL